MDSSKHVTLLTGPGARYILRNPLLYRESINPSDEGSERVALRVSSFPGERDHGVALGRRLLHCSRSYATLRPLV